MFRINVACGVLHVHKEAPDSHATSKFFYLGFLLFIIFYCYFPGDILLFLMGQVCEVL